MYIELFHDRIKIEGPMGEISKLEIESDKVSMVIPGDSTELFTIALALAQTGEIVNLVNENQANFVPPEPAKPAKKNRQSAPRVRYSDIQIQEVLDWVESNKDTFGRQTVLKAEEKFGASGSAIRGWMKKAKAE